MPSSVALLDVLLQHDVVFYVESLFSHYHEVHSFQMGIYAGVLVIGLLAAGFVRTAYAAIVGLFAFSLGVPPATLLCEPNTTCGGLAVQLKPWYFLSGFGGLVVGAPRVTVAILGRYDGLPAPLASVVHARNRVAASVGGAVLAVLTLPVPAPVVEFVSGTDPLRTDGGRKETAADDAETAPPERSRRPPIGDRDALADEAD